MQQRRRHRVVLSLLSLGCLVAGAARATVVRPPANLGVLTRSSAAVVFATALQSRTDDAEPGMPFTITRFERLQSVAGEDPGLTFEVREPGGAATSRGVAVAGAARFADGRSYLLFLDRAPGLRWQSKLMAYGLLVQDQGGDVLRPLAEAGAVTLFPNGSFELPGVYRRDALLVHLRDVAGGASWDAGKVQVAPVAAPSAGTAAPAIPNAPTDCRFLGTDIGDHLPIRWFGFQDGLAVTVAPTTPLQAGISDGGISALQMATTAWTSDPGSRIRLSIAPTRSPHYTCTPGDYTTTLDIDTGAALFNDPCDDLPDFASCGEAGAIFSFSGITYDLTTQTFAGSQWHAAIAPFMVINNGTECVAQQTGGEVNFQEVIGHEVGHTLAFGHHAPADPNDALMSFPYKGNGFGDALRVVDEECATFAYPAGLPFVEGFEGGNLQSWSASNSGI